MGQDLATDEAKIREATANSLKRAQELGLGSIAFPALGAGVGGFPLSQAASIMLEEVGRHLQTPGDSLRRVVFALLGREAYQTFETELVRRLKVSGAAGFPSDHQTGGP